MPVTKEPPKTIEDITLKCSNCLGLGIVIVGDEDRQCPDCDGWGRLIDLDSFITEPPGNAA